MRHSELAIYPVFYVDFESAMKHTKLLSPEGKYIYIYRKNGNNIENIKRFIFRLNGSYRPFTGSVCLPACLSVCVAMAAHAQQVGSHSCSHFNRGWPRTMDWPRSGRSVPSYVKLRSRSTVQTYIHSH